MTDPQTPRRSGARAILPGAARVAGDGPDRHLADILIEAETTPAPQHLDSEMSGNATEVLVRIDSDRAITKAREHVRGLSARAGFGPVDRALLATAVSELGRNILLYAGRGDLLIALVKEGDRLGVAITACDDGPGILDLDDAVRDGYSTSGRPGLGLPGIKRVCDEFHVSSSPDQGTTVSIKKWRDRP